MPCSLRNEAPAEIQRKLNHWITEAFHKPEVRNERKLWAGYIKLAKIEPQ